MKLGIDIGPETARAAILDARGQAQLIEVAPETTALPALVRQTMHGVQVGFAAFNALIGNTETTITGCTRLMGGRATWPASLVERLPFQVHDVAGTAVCNLVYAEMAASTAYAHLVRTLIEAAETTCNAAVSGLVLAVPAGAEHRFRVAARAAAEASGRPVQRIINQPVAALLAAQLPPATKHVAVVNCTAGSVDVVIAQLTAHGPRILATASDMLFGSDTLAWEVVDQLCQRLEHMAQLSISSADRAGFALAGLKRAVDQAFDRLHTLAETMLVLDHGAGFGRDVVTHLSRNDVDTWVQPHLDHLRSLCQRALNASHTSLQQLDQILIIGESATLPMFHQTIAHAFQRPVSHIRTTNAATLAVQGAALAAATESPLVWDVTPYPLGINCYFGHEELLSTIIAANTPIPTPRAGEATCFTQSYQTRFPNQTSVDLELLQYRGPRTPGAEKVRPAECEVLDRWSFSGLQPPPGRHAGFTVTFSIDQNGIVYLTAEETATGHRLDVHTRSTL